MKQRGNEKTRVTGTLIDIKSLTLTFTLRIFKRVDRPIGSLKLDSAHYDWYR